ERSRPGERLNGMRIVLPVTAAVLAASAIAGGCLGGVSHDDVATVPTTGVVVTVGGPAPGAPAPIPGVELRLVGAGGSVNLRADQRGRFTVDLAPGTYRVTITGHGPTANGLPMQPTPTAIVVPHARGERVRLVVPIK
ncbi:MAG TPA: hypothetical protein VM712_00050, partial [Gaiellales bacterium]|nr:hypothetical protein [Gaiellales bacterium]